MQTAPMRERDGSTCWEDPAVFSAREIRRGDLVRQLGALLGDLKALSPDERGAWHRKNRGGFFFAPGKIDARLATLGHSSPIENRRSSKQRKDYSGTPSTANYSPPPCR